MITCLLVAQLACDGSAQGHALEFVRRTIPTGDSMPSMPEGTRNGQSVSYAWDFDTRMNPDAYAGWLRKALTDFRVVEFTAPRLLFATQVGGDAYRLSLTIEGGTAGGAHVHGQLTVSPD